MPSTRKDFLKKLCISGVCLCGFSSLAFSSIDDVAKKQENAPVDDNQQLIQDWISNLLSNLDAELNVHVLRKILKKSSIIHYNNLKMDEVLSPYKGKLDQFIGFIEEKWGWKIEYNKSAKTLIANENKNYCVCPISNYKKGIEQSAMCYCSEGFAEKMFSVVVGHTVNASVISSIRKGDERCIYQIKL
jgi:hypothetical protein